MGGAKTGVLGFEPKTSGASADDDRISILGGGDVPGPIGIDEPVPLVSRIIAKVVKDWDPPNPSNTPEIKVSGSTLEAVARELNRLPEWGQAGGMLRADEIPAGNTTDLTVNLHANLSYRLPTWEKYSSASAAAKKEWDNMFAKLRAHEDRHLAIAVEEGDRLAKNLIGKDIALIGRRVTAANRRMKERQDELDTATDHGAKAGVQYGDVILDISIT
jgi:Bacterial protein of unknown function (DUF922)